MPWWGWVIVIVLGAQVPAVVAINRMARKLAPHRPLPDDYSGDQEQPRWGERHGG